MVTAIAADDDDNRDADDEDDATDADEVVPAVHAHARTDPQVQLAMHSLGAGVGPRGLRFGALRPKNSPFRSASQDASQEPALLLLRCSLRCTLRGRIQSSVGSVLEL